MRIVAFILVVLGLLAVLFGTFSIFGAMPTMIETIAPLGPETTTAAFWWTLAVLLFLASLAFSNIDRKIHLEKRDD